MLESGGRQSLLLSLELDTEQSVFVAKVDQYRTLASNVWSDSMLFFAISHIYLQLKCSLNIVLNENSLCEETCCP